jgi:hypothetical protein
MFHSLSLILSLYLYLYDSAQNTLLSQSLIILHKYILHKWDGSLNEEIKFFSSASSFFFFFFFSRNNFVVVVGGCGASGSGSGSGVILRDARLSTN